MCLYPRIIRNRKYLPNNKNDWIAPVVSDIRVAYVPIGCGNCMECRKQKARQWQVRLLEDIKKNTNGKFITLTFSNESIKHLNTLSIEKYNKTEDRKIIIPITDLEGYEKDNAIATKAMRLFNERWRKKHKKAIRHWMVTELGHQGTENIHLHGIVWTNLNQQKTYDEIEEIWKYGFIWPRNNYRGKRTKTYVNGSTVNYMIKYVNKKDLIHKTYNSIILTSPGIGKNYTEGKGDWEKNKYNDKKTIETYRTETGHKIAMPIYWRNKIYTEEEREKLWIQKLDQETRWVDGIKIDISKGEEQYYKALKTAREKNKQLGYGNDIKDWSRYKYEQERRNIIIKKRIDDAK